MAPPAPPSRRLQLAGVLLVTAACLVWVLWGIDTEKVRHALSSARWSLGVPLLVTFVLTHLLRAWRYGVLVGADVSARRMFGVCAIGFLAINVVPFRLGEFVRPTLLVGDGVPAGQGLGAVVLERLLDFLMLLGLLLCIGWLELPAGRITVQGVDVVAAGQQAVAGVVAVGFVGLVGLVLVGDPAVALFRRVPVVGGRVATLVGGLVGAIRELGRAPLRGLLALALSVATWGMTVVSVWLVLQAFDGLPHTWTAAIVVWTVTIAGMAALPTPGFFGPYEAFCLAALLLWSADPDTARTFAVVLHLSQFGFTVALGLPFLLLEGRGLGELVRDGRAG